MAKSFISESSILDGSTKRFFSLHVGSAALVDWPWLDINHGSQLDVYVEVTLEGSVTLHTKRIGRSQMPVWNEELPIIGDVLSNMSVAIKSGSRSDTEDTCIGQMDVILGALLDRCTNSTFVTLNIKPLANGEGDGIITMKLIERDDVETFMSHMQHTAQCMIDADPNKATYLFHLGIGYQSRFEHFGNLVDIKESINHLSRAVELTGNGNLTKARFFGCLGLSYRHQFQLLMEKCAIDDSITSLRVAVELARGRHPDQSIHLFNLGISQALRFELLDEQADIEEAISNVQKAVDLNADYPFDQPGYLAQLGTLQRDRFETLGESIDLDSSISNLQHAVEFIHDSHPKKSGYLASLAASQQIRFYNFGVLQDLEDSITNLQNASKNTDEAHPERFHYLSTLGLLLQSRFEQLDNRLDIDISIANLQNAVELVDDEHPFKPGTLANLGISQQCRFEHIGEIEDLESSISNLLKAVDLTRDGHPDLPMYLSNLGLAQQSRFERFGRLLDIEHSLSNLKRAIDSTDEDHPNKLMYMANLGISQQSRFGCLGERADIKASIANLKNAADCTSDDDENKPMYLSNLGNSYDLLFEHLGQSQDLDGAISSKQKAADLTDDAHPDKLIYLSNLGNSQRNRFHLLGDMSDLEKSIGNLTHAVEQTDDEHPDKPGRFSNLGISKQSRFEHIGETADIDDSISHFEWAVEHVGNDHPDKSMYFSNLGNSYHRRFERFGELTDLDSAILNQQNAVDLTDDRHPRKPAYLSNLGNSQRQRHRFDNIGKLIELEKSISNLQQAVALTHDGHSSQLTYLANLGLAQQSLFEHLGELTDIDNAIINLEHAVNITKDGHPDKPQYLSNLGSSRESRFLRVGEMGDLAASILNKRLAVELIDDRHPRKATYQSELAGSQALRFKRLGEPSDLMDSISLYKAAAISKTAYPHDALFAARQWAEISQSNGDFRSALDGYRTALEILPKVAWLGLDIAARQDWLSQENSEDIGCLAANCAIRLGLMEEAVELLDLGRSVVWQQASSLRGDFETLREDEPDLAKELETVGRKLEAGNFSSTLVDMAGLGVTAHHNMEEIGRERRHLVGIWESLLERIREQPKFKYFLKPIPFSQLRQAVNVGNVVMINVSRYGVNALIFGASGPIKHLSFPEVELDTLSELSRNIFKNRPINATKAQRRNYVTRYLRPALRAAWDDILTHILENMGISLKCSESLPLRRIWWYLTGPLTFIPMHAAGPGREFNISRVVVSSYVTTLDSLSRAQKSMELESLCPWRLLTVSQKNTPNQCPLPRSTEEVKRVAGVVSSAGWCEDHIVSINDSDATVLEVSEALDQCSWVHFACHGLQDPTSAMKSAFALYDGSLELAHLASKRLAHGRFAFLSVCHAASGLQDLPGEAMHLAAGVQFIGFTSVIATMWGIDDEDAPKVAAHTYEYLFRNGLQKCDPSEAATALNFAVKKLREDPEMTLDRWAPFIHFGI